MIFNQSLIQRHKNPLLWLPRTEGRIERFRLATVHITENVALGRSCLPKKLFICSQDTTRTCAEDEEGKNQYRDCLLQIDFSHRYWFCSEHPATRQSELNTRKPDLSRFSSEAWLVVSVFYQWGYRTYLTYMTYSAIYRIQLEPAFSGCFQPLSIRTVFKDGASSTFESKPFT